MDKTDKLYNICPLITHLNAKFSSLKKASEYLYADESMIQFKGRSTFKQYNPMKPIKRGYKLWCICDTDGSLYRFEIYTGKTDENEIISKNCDMAGNVILRLTKDYKNKHYKVYFDNFFSSVALMEYLQSWLIHSSATIRPQRKYLPSFPADVKMRR